jgi:hypothetical protein
MTIEWGLFERVEAMSVDVFRFWQAECYLDTRANQLLADPASSVVILSPPGAGLSTALALLPLRNVLAFAYPPALWPGQPDAFTSAESHFDQWMGHLAHQLGARLYEQPAALASLDSSSHEFLTWLNQRYRGQRQRELWLRNLRGRLSDESLSALQARAAQPEFATLYSDTGSDIASQVDECLLIGESLNLSGIFARIDASWSDWVWRAKAEREQLTNGLRLLLSSLTPLQRPNFGIKVAISTSLGIGFDELQRLLRGRAAILRWEWSEDETRELVRRYVAGASRGRIDPEPWVDQTVWSMLRDDMGSIWGAPGPAAATAIARQILALNGAAPAAESLLELRTRLYSQAAPIYIDPIPELRTIWRGQQPITLDETPFRLFAALWGDRGHKTDNQHLLSIAGSQASLDQTITRIRRRLEPFYDQGHYLYLRRMRGSYTWLENYRLFE